MQQADIISHASGSKQRYLHNDTAARSLGTIGTHKSVVDQRELSAELTAAAGAGLLQLAAE